MRTLETLLKMARRDVEGLSIEVSNAWSTRQQIVQEKQNCDAAIAVESALAGDSPLGAYGFAAFLNRQKLRQAELDEAQELAESAHVEIKKALAEAYTEVKRLEHLLNQEKIRARIEAEKAEQAVFDERSSQMHKRA